MHLFLVSQQELFADFDGLKIAICALTDDPWSNLDCIVKQL